MTTVFNESQIVGGLGVALYALERVFTPNGIV